MIARAALTARRIGRSLLFAVAAAYVAWATWPGSPGTFATVVARIDVATTVLVLAGLPWLARRFLGPANGRLGRLLRVGGYTAVLALTVAHARILRVAGPPTAGPARQFAWFTEYLFLAVIAGYVAAILAVTARRSRIAPATLAIGTGGGIAFGLVMYAVMPIGFGKDATEPWLAGSAIDPVVALAWILLFGGPMVAGGLAGRLYRGSESDSPDQLIPGAKRPKCVQFILRLCHRLLPLPCPIRFAVAAPRCPYVPQALAGSSPAQLLGGEPGTVDRPYSGG